MSLADKLYEVGLKKVVEAVKTTETLMTEARDAYEAEKKRLEEKERK
jgi:flagellin-specific chaperone FliS